VIATVRSIQISSCVRPDLRGDAVYRLHIRFNPSNPYQSRRFSWQPRAPSWRSL